MIAVLRSGPGPDGGLAMFQSYITERKRAKEELRRSEAYLAEGQRLSHTGSWASVGEGEYSHARVWKAGCGTLAAPHLGV